MVKISESAKEELKKPLGKVCQTLECAIENAKGRRIISVGDVCTLALLDAGIIPHLAVFDFLFMRHALGEDGKAKLRTLYPKPGTYDNPAGTVSDELITDAPALVEKGGGILINGEEDLTALAFIMAAKEGDIIVYGQPNEGLVVVVPDRETKKKAEMFLSLH